MTMEDGRFLVKKDKGIVVCQLFKCSEIAVKRIEKYCGQLKDDEVKDYLICERYSGTAKCSPDDLFDEEIGKQIALERAKKKRNKAVNRAVRKYVKKALRNVHHLRMYGIHGWDA